MRVAEDAALCGLVSTAEAWRFAERLGACDGHPSLPGLRALLCAYVGRLPFQNVTMLAGPRRAPTLSEIREDMAAGRGGPCGVLNPFLAALLHRLGYEVRLISGSMQQPHCHIALCVRLAGQDHWLDAGNGHPYLDVIPLGDDGLRDHAGLCYRVVAQPGGAFAVRHRLDKEGPWKTSYVFTPEPRGFAFFTEMIHCHYAQPGFGPFLGGLRMIRFPDGQQHAIRDRILLTWRSGQPRVLRRTLEDEAALLQAARTFFGDVALPAPEALRALREAGAALFPVAAAAQVPAHD